MIRHERRDLRAPVRVGALLRAARFHYLANMARIVLALMLTHASALVAPTVRRATRLAAQAEDCGCDVMTGDVPLDAQNMKHRSVISDLPLYTCAGTRTSLKEAVPERVAVVAFLRSFG